MNEVIVAALTPLGVPVAFQVYDGNADTYITFFSYNQTPGLITDDQEKATKHYYQVDVWSKANYTVLVQQVKDALSATGFYRINEFDLYENDTGFYHKAIRLSITKEV